MVKVICRARTKVVLVLLLCRLSLVQGVNQSRVLRYELLDNISTICTTTYRHNHRKPYSNSQAPVLLISQLYFLTVTMRPANETPQEQIAEAPAAFRFMDLPHEIRTQILGYTNLVTPFDLKWSTSKGLETNQRDLILQRLPGTTNVSCPAECSCWVFPSAIFLVNKVINEEAMRIFFSRNKFLVCQEPEKPRSAFRTFLFRRALPDVLRPTQRDALTTFLSRVPRRGLQLIRFLEFRFGHHETVYMDVLFNYKFDWNRMAKLLSKHMNLPRLYLRLNGGLCVTYVVTAQSKPNASPDDMLWKNILEALQRHKVSGLACFYVFRCTYVDFNPVQTPDYNRAKMIAIAKRIKNEEKIEKGVMGPDYDSSKTRKYMAAGERGLIERGSYFVSVDEVCPIHEKLVKLEHRTAWVRFPAQRFRSQEADGFEHR